MKAYTEETEPGWNLPKPPSWLLGIIAFGIVGYFARYGIVEYLIGAGMALVAFGLWAITFEPDPPTVDADMLGRWIVGNHRHHGGTLRSYTGPGAFPIESCSEPACVEGAKVLVQLRQGVKR